MTVKAMVAAPNARIYDYWLRVTGKNRREYVRLTNGKELRGWYGPIIVLNGGPIHDADLLSRIRHPSRAGSLTYLEA